MLLSVGLRASSRGVRVAQDHVLFHHVLFRIDPANNEVALSQAEARHKRWAPERG